MNWIKLGAGLLAAALSLGTAAQDFPKAPVKIVIPFPEADLVGLLSVPAGDVPAPLVIFLPCLDSTKEQRHGGRGPLLRRGMAALSLDGPGQGEMSTKLPIRHDFEVAVAAAIDALTGHPRLDTSRVGLIGASLGGYYACRVAAFEPRVTAAVANCGPYRWIDCWLKPTHPTCLPCHCGEKPMSRLL